MCFCIRYVLLNNFIGVLHPVHGVHMNRFFTILPTEAHPPFENRNQMTDLVSCDLVSSFCFGMSFSSACYPVIRLPCAQVDRCNFVYGNKSQCAKITHFRSHLAQIFKFSPNHSITLPKVWPHLGTLVLCPHSTAHASARLHCDRDIYI